jgi:ribosome-associated heat shock protein Hsp15
MARAEPASRPGGAAERVRFDQWLWAARFYRSRSLAATAISAGQARLNGERVKAAHVVRVGDAVSVRKEGLVWDVEVLALADRRGPAAAAAGLYREAPASLAARDEAARLRQAAAAVQPRFPGRPTKRERRKLGDLLGDG